MSAWFTHRRLLSFMPAWKRERRKSKPSSSALHPAPRADGRGAADVSSCAFLPPLPTHARAARASARIPAAPVALQCRNNYMVCAWLGE